MLDALKFAFEILIVGALAIPWIAVLSRMFPGREAQLKFDLGFVPKGVREGAEIAVVLAFAYLLGSAISRFSSDFFNDEIWQPLPTEDVIRDNVYFDEYCAAQFFPYKYWAGAPVHLKPVKDFCPLKEISKDNAAGASAPGPTVIKQFHELLEPQNEKQYQGFHALVQEVFRLQDSALLLEGVDKVDRLKQYFDQINILRGAAFNGFLLLSLALFGCIGELKKRWAKSRSSALLFYLPALAAMAFALRSLKLHWFMDANNRYSDPPLAEIVIILLAAVGLLVTRRAAELTPATEMPYVRICCIALVWMVISVGGWWWTEVVYDRQVIHSLAEMGETEVPKESVGEKTAKSMERSPSASEIPSRSELPSTTKKSTQ